MLTSGTSVMKLLGTTMQYIQFYPTLLRLPGQYQQLISCSYVRSSGRKQFCPVTYVFHKKRLRLYF
jgi:hypothetical protein